MNSISVIVPTLNEADNVSMLIERIAAGFESNGTTYEILFVDDNSIDRTRDVINSYAERYPVRVLLKKGARGKAYSLLEGFEAAQYDLLCMIDADLQYPPEAIVPMHQLMLASDTDVVLTNRQDNATSALRKVTSAGFNFVFTKMMFGFDYDSQSGLKLFKREVIDNITLDPTPWSFDLEFIVRSLEQNYKIVSYDITFAERYAGEAKIQVGKVAYELAKASVKLRLNSSPKKVKSAYKTSNRIAKKTVMATIAAFSMLLLSTVAVSQKTAALEVNGFDLTGYAESILNNSSVQAESDIGGTDDEVEAPTAPVISPYDTQTTTPATTQSTAQQPSAPSPPPIPNTGQPSTPTPDGASLTPDEPPPDKTIVSTGATYPDSSNEKGGFTYDNGEQSQVAIIIKPLSLIALAIAVISIVSYLVMTHSKHFKYYGSSQALKG